ncbi:hypothetical protein Ancab_037773 [Ancistrocladus abbreviatus]
MLLARNLSNLCGCSTLETGVCRRKDEADEAELHGSEGRCKLQGVLEVASREEDRVWLKGSYIGVVYPSVDLVGIQNQLFSSNNSGCEIRSLGGRKVLISSVEEEGVKRLLAEEDRRERPTYQEPEGLFHEDGPSNLLAPQRPSQQPLNLIERSQSIGQGEAKGVDSIQPSTLGKEPVKLKDKSHRRSKKKTLEDILVLGSQKTRLLMQRSMKKQVRARLNNNKKSSNTEERCGESGHMK